MGRIINTDKLDEKYSIKKYPSIEEMDIYIDVDNQDNCWAIEYFFEYIRGKRVDRESIVRFMNKSDLESYIQECFTAYELSHNNGLNNRVRVHYITYHSILYYMHRGNPEKNYIVLNYTEFKNGQYYNDSKVLPKEYEKVLLNALAINKNEIGSVIKNSNYYRLVDVRERRSDKYNKNSQVDAISMSVEDFFDKIKLGFHKIGDYKDEIITGLKILVSSAVLAAILYGGYSLVKTLFKGKVNAIDLKLPTDSKTDKYVRQSTNRATNVMNNIIRGNKEELTRADLEFLVEYLEQIENTNFDKNSSYSVFNYNDYFLPALAEISDDELYSKFMCQNLLNKINILYNKCFTINDKKITINKDECYKFFQFVSSLSYACEVEYRDLPLETMKYTNREGRPGFATVNEIRSFKSLPPVIRLVILTQLKGIENSLKFTFKETPVYYFKSNNYETINQQLNNEMKETIRAMYDDFHYRYSGKAM